jgi:thiol-disulfide isomerase/thioredoxin
MNATGHLIKRRHWLATLAGAAWSWPATAAEVQRRIWLRQPLPPALQLTGLDGVDCSLGTHKGKPVLLNFWASWCEPCRREMPSLELLAAQHEAAGLQVMAVNYRETDAAIRRFVDATALKLPVLRDSEGAAAQALGVHIFPSTIAINRRGQVLFRVVGECDWSSPPASRWVGEML